MLQRADRMPDLTTLLSAGKMAAAQVPQSEAAMASAMDALVLASGGTLSQDNMIE